MATVAQSLPQAFTTISTNYTTKQILRASKMRPLVAI